MKTRLRNFLIGLVGVAIIALGLSIVTAATAATSFSYRVTDLGNLDDGSSSAAYSINDAGQVVGTLQDSNNTRYAFLWESGRMRNLRTLSSTYSEARGINNKGQVVGYGHITNRGYRHAFLWENGKMKDLDPLFSDDSYAKAINKKGQVVGWLYTSGCYVFRNRAFLWENGKMRGLDFLNDNLGYASAINDKGQIVGSLKIDSVYSQAFLGTNGKMTKLGTLSDGYISAGSDINNKGQVVGWSASWSNGRNYTRAFLWENGKMTDLGTFGGRDSYANAINNRGQVVGHARITTEISNTHAALRTNDTIRDLDILNPECEAAKDINNRGQVAENMYRRFPPVSAKYSHAFLWVNGIMRDLNSLISANSGWELTEATDINNKGQIVGYGELNGQTRAFLLTPTWVTR
jgi:probable HAF family extracellular repeat protein